MNRALRSVLHPQPRVQGAKADAVLAQFERPPTSLEVPPEPNAEDEMAAVAGANSPLRRLLWLLGFNSSEAVNIRAATRLYDAICTQTDTPGLHDSVQMEPVFYSRWCAQSPSERTATVASRATCAQAHPAPGPLRCGDARP